MRRVLVLTNRYPVGPKDYAGWYVAKHCEIHRQQGWLVRVVAPPRIGGHPLWRYAFMALSLVPRIVRRDFDLVHAHWILPSGWLGLTVARMTGRPLLVTSHGAFVRNIHQRSRFERAMVRRVLTGADWVVGVGREHLAQIQAIVQGAPLRASQIHMGVELDQPAREGQDIRTSLGVPPEAFLVLYVGNLFRRKGVDILLRAYALLTASGAGYELRVVGKGPALPDLKMLCGQLGIGADRVFVGPIPHQDVRGCYRAANVVVVPSRDEPSGLVAMEAMAAGGAVIASDVGGLRDSIRDGKTGLLVPPGDAEALAQAIRRVRESAELESDLRQRAAQAAADFDIRRRATEVGVIYRRLLGMPEDDE